jgi:hypothetical protein
MRNQQPRPFPQSWEGFHKSHLLLARLAVGRVAADWLCGNTPKAVHSSWDIAELTPKQCIISSHHYAEIDGDPGPVFHAAAPPEIQSHDVFALYLKKALVRMAGAAAVLSVPFNEELFPGSRDVVAEDFNEGRACLRPVCSTAAMSLSVAYVVWDGAITLFQHPRVSACVEELANKAVKRRYIRNDDGELDAHFQAHLAGLRASKFDDEADVNPALVLSWPRNGISEFVNPNWGTVMLASAAKGRAHYARLR